MLSVYSELRKVGRIQHTAQRRMRFAELTALFGLARTNEERQALAKVVARIGGRIA